MSLVLAKSAQSVQEALNAKGLECQVVELPDSARTAEQAAQAIGCEVGQIVKSLIFKTAETNQPVLLLVSGANRVNEQRVQEVIDRPILKADAEFTREVTGFAIGGIPPVGHKQKIDYILIDQDLLQYDTLWAAAGTPHAVFNMRSQDLVAMTDGRVVRVC